MLNPSLISHELNIILITKFPLWDYCVLCGLLNAIYLCTINIPDNKFTNILIGVLLVHGSLYNLNIQNKYQSIIIFIESAFWLREIMCVWLDLEFDAGQCQYVFFGTSTMLGASTIYEFSRITRKIIM